MPDGGIDSRSRAHQGPDRCTMIVTIGGSEGGLPVAQLQLPRVDANTLRERMRDIDLSRLADLGEELQRLDLADSLKGLDLDALRHLGDGKDLGELDLAPLRDSPVVRRVQRALGREPRRNLWSMSMPPLSATLLAGAVIVLGGALIGGLVAWLYQPGKGDQRRAKLRRKVKRVVRKVRGVARPA